LVEQNGAGNGAEHLGCEVQSGGGNSAGAGGEAKGGAFRSAQLTAAADQFLARLDHAIGPSNALARARSGAARMLDGVRRGSDLLLPSEQEADRRAQA